MILKPLENVGKGVTTRMQDALSCKSNLILAVLITTRINLLPFRMLLFLPLLLLPQLLFGICFLIQKRYCDLDHVAPWIDLVNSTAMNKQLMNAETIYYR